MKTINEALAPVLESAIKDSLKKFENQKNENSLSDLYIRFDADNALLIIYDDVENKLTEISLEKEQERNEYPETFEKQLISTTQWVLSKLNQKQFFNQGYIFKPFAVSFVDDDFIVSEELIFIDDNTLKLDGELLSNLDKDLDDFLKELMK